MKYLENRYVTLSDIQLLKPLRAGTVYMFGTIQPNVNELLNDILQWIVDNSKDNQMGRLLTI